MGTLNDSDIMFIESFLMAFKCVGGNELGLIDYKEFKVRLLAKSGDVGKEIIQLIEEENCVNNDKLDFVSLCGSILSSKALFNKMTSENGKIVASSPRINSRTFTRKKSNLKTTTNNLGDKSGISEKFVLKVGGSIYYINKEYFSNHYQLEMLENSAVEIFAKPVISGDCIRNIPIEILIFQDKNKAFIASSSTICSEGYNSAKFHLKKGKYVIMPFLLKWDISDGNLIGNENLESLMDIDSEGQVTLTTTCERALETVFHCIDLDGNGLLNQLEFDLFIRHTSGETAADEWSTIEDNFKMKDGQLTLEGFLELYKMVLQTDPSDAVNMFQQMGMNESLETKNVQPFTLVIKSESTKLVLTPLPVSSYSTVVEKILRKITVEQGSSSKVKNMNDLFLYTHRLPHRITIVVQNQSHSKVNVKLDCTRSNNCESHRQTLDFCVEVPPRSSLIGHHLFPINPNLPWSFQCIESLK